MSEILLKFFPCFSLVIAFQASAFHGRETEEILKSSSLLFFLENKIKKNNTSHIYLRLIACGCNTQK